MASGQYQPILFEDDKSDLVSVEYQPNQFDQRAKSRYRQLRASYFVHSFLIILYTIVSYLIIRATTAHCEQKDQGTNFFFLCFREHSSKHSSSLRRLVRQT